LGWFKAKGQKRISFKHCNVRTKMLHNISLTKNLFFSVVFGSNSLTSEAYLWQPNFSKELTKLVILSDKHSWLLCHLVKNQA
jgi:hypothetical protein